MTHFNPAVTVAFLITKHLERKKGLLLIYLLAEIIGGILASVFIYFILFLGMKLIWGANVPNYIDFPIYVIVGIEILAAALRMLIILIVVYTKGLKKIGGIAIGATVGLDIFFFGLISDASMNPASYLVPVVVSGYYSDIWLYLTAPFIETTIVALLLRNKF